VHVAPQSSVTRPRLFGIALLCAGAGVSSWLFAAGEHGTARDDARLEQQRNDAFKRAVIYLDPRDAGSIAWAAAGGRPIDQPVLPCRFVRDEPSGTSPKFSCLVDNGDGTTETVKVKYGRNPEIQAEVAGTRLLRDLGLAADRVRIVPRVRCYGCPRFPFLTMHLMTLMHAAQWLERRGDEDGYTDFEWVGVEQKFPAPSIETDTQEGWAWFELKSSQAPPADVDALRLLAVFLAHWDNKAGNQRLVCLDQPASAEGQPCARPLLMIQDLGATFGPEKVNLARWRDMPIWADRGRCVVSMRALPYRGATFPDATISEAGRLQLAQRLSAFTEDRIRQLFVDARFPQFYSATDDNRDLDAWTTAFRLRVEQIVNAGPCKTLSN
jgi:hypothetical protein